jgi:hypothetical protein
MEKLMNLARVARNVFLARLALALIARRRAALARKRRSSMLKPVLIAGGAGLVWAARPRLLAGARRAVDVAQRRLDRNAEARRQRESQRASAPQRPDRGEKVAPEGGAPIPGPRRRRARVTKSRPEPSTSPKKRRKRARQERAAQREHTERDAAQGGTVNVEVNEPEELRAPLGELKH